MLLEGLLAVVTLIAIAGGLGLGLEKHGHLLTGAEAFRAHYASWAGAQGLAVKIEAFVVGAANLMAGFGLPKGLGRAVMGVFIVSFAGTTLDSATRIQRISLQELCKNRQGLVARPVNNRLTATLIVVGMAALLTFLKPGAMGALILWPLFGALNQLLAALGLSVATVYLVKIGKNYLITLLPALFMLAMTVWAMVDNLHKFLAEGDILLTALSLIIFALTAWLLIGAASSMARHRKYSIHQGQPMAVQISNED
jgi:carbon starvation protein